MLLLLLFLLLALALALLWQPLPLRPPHWLALRHKLLAGCLPAAGALPSSRSMTQVNERTAEQTNWRVQHTRSARQALQSKGKAKLQPSKVRQCHYCCLCLWRARRQREQHSASEAEAQTSQPATAAAATPAIRRTLAGCSLFGASDAHCLQALLTHTRSALAAAHTHAKCQLSSGKKCARARPGAKSKIFPNEKFS